jgi:hypothetical protein
MKEKVLQVLGFERVDITKEESGSPNDWYYYTYDFTKDVTIGGFSLISCDNEEAKKNGWYVEIFENDDIRFTKSKDLFRLIELINKNIR